MCSSIFGRLFRILSLLNTAEIIGLQGTQQPRHPFMHDSSDCFQEHCDKYVVYHWPAGDSEFTNRSTGVSIAIDPQYIHPCHHVVLSPPHDIQGRAGAVICLKTSFRIAIVSLYQPASGSDSSKQRCNDKIFQWVQTVLDEAGPHAQVLLLLDGNARVGFDLDSQHEPIPQDPQVVGTLRQEASNQNGRDLVCFLSRNKLALVNTFVGTAEHTFVGWRGQRSRIDYIATRQSSIAAVQTCTTWRRTALQLQLCKTPHHRDHFPLVAYFPYNLAFRPAPRRHKWNFEDLLRPQSCPSKVVAAFDNIQHWISDHNVESQLLHFSDQGFVDDAWNLLNDGLMKCMNIFQQPQQSQKYPPSQLTLQLRQQKAQAWDERCRCYVNLDDAPLHLPSSQSAVLRSWFWTQRQIRVDKALSTSRRSDRTDWRDYWSQQLQSAITAHDSRRSWYLARRIAGTGIGRGKRFLGHVSPAAPTAFAWTTHLRKSGPQGGSEALPLAWEQRHDNVIPFKSVIPSLNTQSSCTCTTTSGGGRGSLWRASSSVPHWILKQRETQSFPLSACTLATTDLEHITAAIHRGKRGKQAPPWSMPLEAWKLVLTGAPEIPPIPQVLRCFWLFLLSVRRAHRAPVLWKLSMGIPLPKSNGEIGCDGQRLIHLLDPCGKLWCKCQFASHQYSPPPWAYGFLHHRRREQPVLQHRIVQHRVVKAGFSWAFRKYDIKNAFPSITWEAVDQTVHDQIPDPDTQQYIKDRYHDSLVVVEGQGSMRVLLQNHIGVLQGDVSAPELFSGSYNRLLHRWDTTCEYQASSMLTLPLSIEDFHTDTLHKTAMTVLADDVGRALTFSDDASLIKQVQFWDTNLDALLRQYKMANKPSKTRMILSTRNSDRIKSIHKIRFPMLKESLCTKLTYLGCHLHWKGDLTKEVQEHIHRAQLAWRSLGTFWYMPYISEKFKVTVFKGTVRQTLLAGLEAMALPIQHLQLLEVAQNKFARKMLCGQGCLKTLHTATDGTSYTVYRALSNTTVRTKLSLSTIASEMIVRRLSWLQQMLAFPHDSAITLATLQGAFIWENHPPIDRRGELASDANPWTIQFFGDLSKLADTDPCFRALWIKEHWWSIYNDYFQHANIKHLRSYHDFQPDAYSFHFSSTLCPGTATLQPYSVLESSHSKSKHRSLEPDPDNMDPWKPLPPVTSVNKRGATSSFHSARDEKTARTARGKGSDGPSGPTQKQYNKALVNLDNRVRACEGITQDAFTAPQHLPEVIAAMDSGKRYQQAVAQAGRGNNTYGSPYVREWSDFIAAIAAAPDTPPELQELIRQHRDQYNTTAKLEYVIRHFTSRPQHGKDRVIINVHVKDRLFDFWQAIRMYLNTRGVEQYTGDPPRGPIFREFASSLR
jgi:hypothetical protein